MHKPINKCTLSLLFYLYGTSSTCYANMSSPDVLPRDHNTELYHAALQCTPTYKYFILLEIQAFGAQ